MTRLKKIARTDLDERDSKGALVYINGEIYVASTHAMAIHKYLLEKGSEGLFDSGNRPRKYDYDQNFENETKYDKLDVEEIEKYIQQLGFAHINSNKMIIYVEEATLQNVDLQTVVSKIRAQYPDYSIVNDDTNEKIYDNAKSNNEENTDQETNKDTEEVAKKKSRLKRVAYHNEYNRQKAIVYINGEILEGQTHAECLNQYFQNGSNENYYRPKLDLLNNDDSIQQLAFAHKDEIKKCIFVESKSLKGISLSDVANKLKQYYKIYDIYDDNSYFNLSDDVDDYIKVAKKKMKKQAAINNDLDSFPISCGDMIAIGYRIVNNKPWYQVYQEGQFSTSSYYDGPDKDTAIRMYKDLMTAFNGVGETEQFNDAYISDEIEKSINEKQKDEFYFQQVKTSPLFLGVNDFA